jgi:GTP-binding protein HflX
VVDGSNPDFLAQIEQVQRVLAEIGAAQVPQLLVFNKLDALENARWPLHMVDMFEVNDPDSESARSLQRVFVSAQSGQGLPVLRQLLADLAGSSLGEDSPFTPEAVA